MPKIELPDGKGGFLKVEAERRDGQTIKDPERQQAIHAKEQQNAFWKRVGQAATRFNAMEKAYGTEAALTEEEMFAAKYLDLLNWQHWFPKELGGPAHATDICKTVQAWFLEQLND